jgi:hypothetical protein
MSRTTQDDIRTWLAMAGRAKATHMIVATDQFDWSDYPIFVPSTDYVDDDGAPITDPKEVRAIIVSKPMSGVMECYDLRLPLEMQLAEQRANHWDETTPS